MAFLFGTHYYRYPTPEPQYWDQDLAHLKRLGFDFFQVRPQWRSHEREEGKYTWDDIDGLFERAEKQGLKIVFKFMLETAPEWIYDRYQAHRIHPDGRKITPHSNGAMYVGGWLPCFDNPVVREKAVAFVAEGVKRYRNSPALHAWHAWNEPRNRPYGECACGHSNALYRASLREKFGTVEKFNARFGLAETSFDAVKPPPVTDNFTLVALWKSWGRSRAADRVRLVTRTIKSLDATRPVICHSGFCAPLQDILNDGVDDHLTSREADIYGCSYPHFSGECSSMSNQKGIALFASKRWRHDQFIFGMMADWIRSVKKEFMVYELYSNGWGMEHPDFTDEDLRFRIYEAVSSGARGINLWQFRAERYATESGGCGLVNIDGSDTPRSREVQRFNGFKNKHRSLLDAYEKDRGDLAIVYDPDSDLLSRLEGTEAANQENCVTYRYKNSLKGWYSMCWRSGLNADFVPSAAFERISDYPAVILPYFTCVTPAQAETLRSYVEKGGVAVADPGLGLRDHRYWIHETLPSNGLDKVFGVRHGLLKGGRIGKPVMANVFGKGRTLYFGSFPAERHFLDPGFPFKATVTLLKKAIGFRELFRAPGLVVVKWGRADGKRGAFVLNYERRKAKVSLLAFKKTVAVGPREVKWVEGPGRG